MKRIDVPTRACEYWPWARPTPGRALTVAPLVVAPPIYVMHRIDRRMVPCDDVVCNFCDPHNQPTEQRIIFPAMRAEDQVFVMVDVPSSQLEALRHIAGDAASLFGTLVKFYRVRQQSNAPISCYRMGSFNWKTQTPYEHADIDRIVEGLLAANTAYARAFLSKDQKSDVVKCSRIRDRWSARA